MHQRSHHQARRHAEADHVGQRIKLLAEFAGPAGLAGHAAVEGVTDHGSQDRPGGDREKGGRTFFPEFPLERQSLARAFAGAEILQFPPAAIDGGEPEAQVAECQQRGKHGDRAQAPAPAADGPVTHETLAGNWLEHCYSSLAPAAPAVNRAMMVSAPQARSPIATAGT